jgi:homoserine kinase type II
VVTDRGAAIFLRINENKAEDEVVYEARVVAHLASRGVATPAPLNATSGQPFARLQNKPITLFPWVAGRHLGAREVARRHVEKVGAQLARLHLCGADFPERRPGIYTLEHIGQRFRTFARSGDPKLSQVVPLIREELERLPVERTPDLPEGLIHQDLFRDNVLWGDDGDAIAALIDFEQAAWGRWAYDLAVTILAWCFHDDAFDAPLVAEMLRGYESVRRLTDNERVALPMEARVAAVRFTVTRVTDVYLRSGAPSGKDFRSYFSRMRVLRERGLPTSF